jgi:chromate transport protein ChrA
MLKLLAPFLTSLAAGEVGLAVDRVKRRAVFLTFVGILGVIGVIFLLVAGYIALAERYGELQAALYIGAGAIVLAIVLYIIMKISDSMTRKRQKDRAKVDTSALLTIAALAAAPAVLRSRSLLMLAIPVIAFGGLSLLGKQSPRRRRPSRRPPSAGDGI